MANGLFWATNLWRAWEASFVVKNPFSLLRLLCFFAARKSVFIRVHPWLIGF